MKHEFVPSEKIVESFKNILNEISAVKARNDLLNSSMNALAEKMLRMEGVKDEDAQVNYDSQSGKFFVVIPEEEGEK